MTKLLGLLALAVGCKSEDTTKIVIEVWSDLVVPTEFDQIRIDLKGRTEKASIPFELAPTKMPEKTTLPVRLGVVPIGSGNDAFGVLATGLLAENEIVWQEARVSFVAGESLLLKLFLEASCAGRECDADYTCSGGVCTRPVLVTHLPPFNPAAPPLPPDGSTGVMPDSGPGPGDVPSDRAPDLAILDAAPDTGSDSRFGPSDVLGSGGAPGSGGIFGSGGGTGTGGARATGGAMGTGGAVGSGGLVGTGGTEGRGGTLGTGGAVGTGGAIGADAGTVVARYVVSPNGLTVTDTLTLLVWQRDALGSRPNCALDPNCTWAEAKAYCAALTLDGSGWRLPTKDELLSIVDNTATTPPTINQTAFPNTPAVTFWSSSPFPNSSTQAFSVGFARGYLISGPASSEYRARCVR